MSHQCGSYVPVTVTRSSIHSCTDFCLVLKTCRPIDKKLCNRGGGLHCVLAMKRFFDTKSSYVTGLGASCCPKWMRKSISGLCSRVREREVDRQIGAATAVMWPLYLTIVVKGELSRKAELSIYQSIYLPTLTFGHELWVVTKRMVSFLCRVAGLSLRDKELRHPAGAQSRTTALPHWKEPVEVFQNQDPPGRFPLEVSWAL